MKRRWVLALACAALALGFMAMWGAGAEETWSYRLDGEGLAHITGYVGGEAKIAVPTAVDGHAVVGLDAGAICVPNAQVTIPALVTELRDGALPQDALVRAGFGTTALDWAVQAGLRWKNTSRLDFAEGVIDLSGDAFTRKDGLFCFDPAYRRLIGVGSLFYIPPENNRDMGCVYEARELKTSKGRLEVAARTAAPGDSYRSFSVHMEDLGPDYAHAEILSSAVRNLSYSPSVNDTTVTVEDGGVLLQARRAKSLDSRYVSLDLEVPTKRGSSARIKVGLNLSLEEFDLSFSNHFGRIDHMKVLFRDSISGEFKATRYRRLDMDEDDYTLGGLTNVLNGLPLNGGTERPGIAEEGGSKKQELLRVPFNTPSGFTFSAVVWWDYELEGSIGFSYSLSADVGAEYDGKTWRNLSHPNEPELTVELEAGFTVDLNLSFTASLPMLQDIAELDFTLVELKGTGTAAYEPTNPGTRLCIDGTLETRFKVSVGMGLRYALQKLGKQARKALPDLWLSAELMDAQVWEKHGHYEPGNGWVDACTRGGVKVTFDPNDPGQEPVVRYYPAHSSVDSLYFPAVAREGYTLDAWLLPDGSTCGALIVEAEPITLYARWTPREGLDAPETPTVSDQYDREMGLNVARYYFQNPDYITVSTEIGFTEEPAEHVKQVLDYVRPMSRETVWKLSHENPETYGNLQDIWNVAQEYPGRPLRIIGYEGANCALKRVHYTSDFIGLRTRVGESDYMGGNRRSPYLEEVIFDDGYGAGYADSVTIPDFRDCVSLKHVRLPSNLTGLGFATFMNCTALEEIDLPDGIESMGGETFTNCTSLRRVKLPASLKTLGNSFKYCTSLEHIDLPDSLEEILLSFMFCSSLQEIELPPATNTVGPGSFYGCDSLKTVTGHYTGKLGEAGVGAFDGLPALETVRLQCGDGTDICDFNDTPALKTVEITCDGTLTLGGFRNSGVESVTIRADRIILSNAFRYCDSLKNLTLDGQVEFAYDTFMGSTFTDLTIDSARGFDLPLPALGSRSLRLTLNVGAEGERVRPRILACKQLAELTIDGDCALDADWGIRDNNQLTELTLIGAVSLGEDAVGRSPSLRRVTVDAMTGEAVIGVNAFRDCEVMEELIVGEGCRRIDSPFLYGGQNMRRIVVPGSVEYIDLNYFTQYPRRLVMEAPEGSRAAQQEPEFLLGPYTMSFQSEFGELHLPYTGLTAGAAYAVPEAKDLSLPNNLRFDWWYQNPECTVRADGPFMMPAHDVVLYAKLTQDDPENMEVEYVEREAADGTTEQACALVKLNCWYDYQRLSSRLNILRAESLASYWIKAVVLPGSVDTVDDGAFRTSLGLETILVSADNAHFHATEGALYDNHGRLIAVPCGSPVTEFTVEPGTTAIADYAFGCTQYGSKWEIVNIPDSVTDIGPHAFDGLGGGTLINCGRNSAAARAAEAAGLNHRPSFVVFMSEGECWSFFYDVSVGDPLPDVATPEREGAQFTGWGESQRGPVAGPGYRVPEGGAVLYAMWSDGTPVPDWTTLPAMLDSIDDEAFAGTAFEAVWVPDGVTRVGSRAFAGCAGLRLVRLPQSVTEIAGDAFDGAPDLTVVAPEGSPAAAWAAANGHSFEAE